MGPVVTSTKARAAIEALGAAGISVIALTIDSSELAIVISAVSALIGIVVWLVRLEGRVNLQGAILERIDRRVEKLAGEDE